MREKSSRHFYGWEDMYWIITHNETMKIFIRSLRQRVCDYERGHNWLNEILLI